MCPYGTRSPSSSGMFTRRSRPFRAFARRVPACGIFSARESLLAGQTERHSRSVREESALPGGKQSPGGAMTDPRERMAEICRLAYDRKLLDSAGGNLTVRAGERVYMSRSYAGGKWQWRLRPEDFLVLDLDGHILAGEGEFSREGAVHMACYHAFAEAGCVFHAHPLNVMPFV